MLTGPIEEQTTNSLYYCFLHEQWIVNFVEFSSGKFGIKSDMVFDVTEREEGERRGMP